MPRLVVVEDRTQAVVGFEIGYVDDAGRQRRDPLAEVVSSAVAFENISPSRAFPSFRGQRNNSGWWFFATTGAHVGFESWLERDHVMLRARPTERGPSRSRAARPIWRRGR